MFAVQAEAVGAFKRKDWVALITLLGGVKGVGAQLGAAWAELELGRIDEGVARIRELFAAVSGPLEIAPTLPWSLWSLRKHVGPSRLMEWGLHDAVIERLWLELRDLPVDPSNAFAKEWVDGGLLAFMTALPERARPPVPWQLGGVAAVLSDEAWAQVLAWARGEAKAIGVGARSTFWTLERAASSSPGSVGERVRALGAFGYEVSVLAKDEAMRRLGETLDARLLLEDVRPRVPAA